MNSYQKNLDQYDITRVLGCEPVDGVLVVLSSNQINIAIFVHQMGDSLLDDENINGGLTTCF